MGEVFAGRYELADPIGRGGVGAVWRAWDHRRRRYVAAKVLQQRDAHSLLRFVREQALRIDHPNVLAPASWAADDDKVLFTMDLVAGGSLVHLVGDYGPLPPAFVCTLLDQLLSGLAAVHAEGVVHRDVKPANVLLEATGTGRPRLRLSDFGIAMRLGEPRLTETNLVVGTPGYLAPEQMLGAEPDFPADLFAAGLVALYLLEGAKPDSKALVQYFLEHGTPGPPKGVPEPLWQVVASLLQPDPGDRFRTATGARKALAAAVELLPEPGPDDELVEIFDQLGPLPPGFGPEGPLVRASGLDSGPNSEAATDAFREGAPGAFPAAAPGAFPAAVPGAFPAAAPGAFPAAVPGAFPAAVPGADGSNGTGTGARASSRTSGSAGPGEGTPTGTGTGSLSDTGSFRLPPPLHPPAPAPAPDARVDSVTAPYTAHDPRVPLPVPPPRTPPVPSAPPVRGRRRGRRAARRPGPPARAVIPLLLLALACYAVGFWALTRV
ncbi:serine/threonine protein kinase [Streptomyces actinomycinicus]|uniref:non-specific serine/threonine protein kinase n=1 Tax=Streptomyces actinomycinicus TaxID=1695166 RepID=A0A937EJN5_9ACTN|nr:serine/threonine-protein kinase [Streptomyces actinomycinicus]MBL1083234.1 serine/threonine protein kinase [Streptomyces actinomycinicus]